jgi:RNA polymerase sigma factor (sigma-70 family)
VVQTTTVGERTDEALMRAYVGGETAAFRVLFERLGPGLFQMARRHTRSEEEAREVVQGTFLRVHAARNDFRDGARVRPWVTTIAMNLVREHWRRGKRRPTSPLEHEPAAESDGRDALEVERRAEAIRVALESLPESQRAVVELHWFQELPFADVARMLGSTEGAVRVRAHRAYQTLKTLLSEVATP